MSEDPAPYNVGMTRQDFLDLVWRLEEMLMELDYSERQDWEMSRRV